MKFATLCSGIGAPEVAWAPRGWSPQFYAEIEPFPCAVMEARHPGIPNIGTIVGATPNATIDLLIAGTPCQSFSVAGKRVGLGDPRGVLVYEFLRIVDHLRPRWFIWKNVPGVLSSGKGKDFGAILAAMEQLGYRWAYRTLDAQYFGVPQRRRRIFLVGHLGNWNRPAAVLFDSTSLRGNPQTRRKTRPPVTGTLGARTKAGGGLGTDFDTLGGVITTDPSGDECQNLIAHASHNSHHSHTSHTSHITHSLSAEGHDASEEGTGRGVPITAQQHGSDVGPFSSLRAGHGDVQSGVPFVFEPRCARNDRGAPDTVCPPLKAESGETGKGDAAPCVAFTCKDHGADASDLSPTLRACNHIDGNTNGGGQVAVAFRAAGQDGFTPSNVTPPIAASDGGGVSAPTVNIISGRDRGYDGRGYPREPHISDLAALDTVKPDRVITESTVRRLTPLECERLQGFPDNYTLIDWGGHRKWADYFDTVRYLVQLGFPMIEAAHLARTPDGPRYRAIGNSMAVPVIRWLGERIALVESL